jgi:hypothetical protein
MACDRREGEEGEWREARRSEVKKGKERGDVGVERWDEER